MMTLPPTLRTLTITATLCLFFTACDGVDRPAPYDPNAPPSTLKADDIYDVQFNEGVTNLDLIPSVTDVRVKGSKSCPDGSKPEPLFGSTCPVVTLPVAQLAGQQLTEGDLIFSAKHRLMGRVDSVEVTPQEELKLRLSPATLDEIFYVLHIRATIPVAPEAVETESGVVLETKQSALSSDSEEPRAEFGFEIAKEFTTSLLTGGQGSMQLSGRVALLGEMDVFIKFGGFFSDEEKVMDMNVRLQAEALAQLATNFQANKTFKREAKPVEVTVPLRLGWFFADVNLAIKPAFEAAIEGKIDATTTWRTSEEITANVRYTSEEGMSTKVNTASEPGNLNSVVEASGEARMKATLDVSISLIVYKMIGAEFTLVPGVGTRISGELKLDTNEPLDTAKACFEITSDAELTVTGRVRGLKPFSLYKDTLFEKTLFETDQCGEEEPEKVLSSDFEGPGVHFSCTIRASGRCTQYHGAGMGKSFAEFARSCKESDKVEYSPYSCDERFGQATLVGICSMTNASIYYYTSHLPCSVYDGTDKDIDNERVVCDVKAILHENPPQWTWGPACHVSGQ